MKPPSDGGEGGAPHRDRYDWITLWTAVIGVAIVAISTGVTAYQALLTRDELASLTAQQRAWVKLEPRAATGIGIFPKGGAMVGVDVYATNVGALPAQYAWATAIVVATGTAPAGKNPEMSISPLNFCQPPKRYQFGLPIFPGQTVKLDTHFSPWPTRKEIDAQAAFNGAIRFLLVVCAQYDTGTSRTPRRTVGIYQISPKEWKRGAPYGFPASGGVFEPEEIEISLLPLGAVAD